MRALAWFWAALLVLAAGGAGFLQWHGPPASAESHAVLTRPAEAPAATHPAEPVEPTAAAPISVRTTIPPPDKALLEPSKDFAGGFLPRIGTDRRSPSVVYAAAEDASGSRPKIAILVSGIGMSAADSNQAILAAPAPISLAVSPYAVLPDALLADARQHGHELFLSLPMEPKGYPLNDPGNHALLTGNTPAANAQQLAWAMTRFGGYVGATGSLGALLGERFADNPTQMGLVLNELTRRGLLYVDPRPGAVVPPGILARDVDLLIDRTPSAPEIDASLQNLEKIARARGAALGLIMVPRPVAMARLLAWATGLPERGVALVPVSALVRTPPRAQQAGP